MQKIALPLIIMVMMLSLVACTGGQRLSPVFKPQAQGSALNAGQVYLVVTDERPYADLVGPAAREKGLFAESQGGLVDLTSMLPGGNTISLTRLDVTQAVREAVTERLKLLNIKASDGTEGSKAQLNIKIKKLTIDLVNKDIVSSAALEAVISHPQSRNTYSSKANSDSSKLKLVGDMGGSDTLGDVLTQTINHLDFSSLNNF